MENNKNIRELYSIYLELGHEVFEEKIKKPMELYLHANSNVISMNSLKTIIANAMEKSKLGEVGFDEHDLFSPQARRRKFTSMILYLQYMMITMMSMIFSVHLLLRRKLIMITICLLYLMTMVMRIIMIAILLNFLPL
jgi:hypothetical protein